MTDERTAAARGRCLECGFEAERGGEQWGTARHPSLGSLTSCPDCGSTNVTSVRR